MKEDIFFRNNTGNKSKQSLIGGYVIRINEFESIFKNLTETSSNNHKQNYLIIGQRGAGKTSLMHRINYAIEDHKKLSKSIIPIMFTEEQYYLSELVNLWENVAIYLEDHYAWSNLSNEMERIIFQENDFERKAYELLCSRLKEADKTLVLFIENISMFYNKLTTEELSKISDILIKDNFIRLIGTSTTFVDGSIDFTNTAFSYFKIIQLDGLNKEECENLLLKIADQYDKTDQMKVIIENHPGRIEALRRLTGGIPRTISYLFQIFLDNENGKAIKDLYLLIDTLTLLYKSELDRLSTQQQKVIDIIARKWDAIAVKDIVKGTRLESKNISKILAALEKDQLIEKVNTDSKNHLYRIRERFMNIWYLMRFGRKHDKENVIWLVRFFDAWCEKKELDKLVAAHIDNLKDGPYDLNAAIDMGNTFLSCVNVSEALKGELMTVTESILPEKMLKSVKWSRSNKTADITTLAQLISDKKYDEAIDMLDNIENKDVKYYKLASTLFLMVGNFESSADAAKNALGFDNTDAYAALTLGIIYEDYLKDIETAIKYYEQSVSQNPYHPYAASRLGDIFFLVKHDIPSAIKYHQMAVKKSFRPSLLSLGKIYMHQNNMQEAEKTLLEAKRHRIKDVNIELGQLYARLGQNKKAKDFFEIAVKNNEEDALLYFGYFYQHKSKPEFDKAEFYYGEAIKAGSSHAYGFLGKLYHRSLNNKEKAFETYSIGIKHDDVTSVHQMAHLYADKRDLEQANSFFLKANKMGDETAVLCMAANIYGKGKKEYKHIALQALEENLPKIRKEFPAEIFYAKILLWNDEVEKSIQIIKNSFDLIVEIKNDVEKFNDDDKAGNLISELVSYFSLLLAKQQYKLAFQLFNDKGAELKIILKPVYFVLMDLMKNEYPLEYLRAGDEFTDTIQEIKSNINKLQKRI